MGKNYYEILQVTPEASKEVIAMAYKALVKKYHPDNMQNNPDEATEMLKQLNEAFDVLSDDVKRTEYDNALKHNGWKNEERQAHKEQSEPVNVRTENREQVQHAERRERTSIIGLVFGTIIDAIISLFEGIAEFFKTIMAFVILFVIIGLFTGKLGDWASRLEYYGLSVVYALQKEEARTTYDEGTPEYALNQYIQSLFAGDLYEASKYIEKDGTLKRMTEEITDLFKDTDDVIISMTKDMTRAEYSIKEEDGTYTVTFTTKDYGQIYSQLEDREQKRLTEYEMTGDVPTQKEIDKLEKQDIRFIKTKIYKAKKNLKYDVAFRLRESGDGYVITEIQDVDSILNALTGNLFKAVEQKYEEME